jgi:hypothetical protein
VRRAVEVTLLCGVCAFALLLWFPLTRSHWFQSHEADSYVLRAVAYLEALRSGELFPRWAGDMYGGFGCPFFVFYPPLVYGLAALSAPLLGSVVVGLKAVALLATLSAGVSMYLLARQETGRPDAAALAAAVYLAAPYRLWDLYGRGDLAEYTALGFLPLALYGYRRAAAEPVLRRAARFAALAAVAHALSVFSHTLLGFYGSGALLLCVAATAVSAWQRGARRHVTLLGVAFGSALALSAVYTLPAAVEKSLVRIDTMHTGDFAPSQHWLPLARLSELGQYFFLPAVACAVFLLLLARARRRALPTTALVCLVVAGVVLVLQLPQASPFWTLSPLLTIIQFPWRLLGLGWIALSLFAALAWSALVRGPLAVRALAVSQLSWLAALGCVQLSSVEPAPADAAQPAVEVLRSRLDASTGLDEYLPRTASARPRAVASSVVADVAGVTTDWEINSNTRHVLALSTEQATLVPLNLYAYPGWELAESDAAAGLVELTQAPGGYVGLRLAQPGSYRVVVRFANTPLRTLASCISVLTLLGFLPALAWLSRSGGVPLRARLEGLALGVRRRLRAGAAS